MCNIIRCLGLGCNLRRRRACRARMDDTTGNFILPAFPGLIVKDSYWRWSERDQAGNAIDFFTLVLGLSFHDAMRQITGT